METRYLAMKTNLLLAFSLLLCACASAPASPPSVPENQPSTAASQPTATVEAEANPTLEPSPTPTQMPYSGPNPRLAVVRWDESEELFIDVFELGSEELVASVPVDDSWILALSPDGRQLFNYGFLSPIGTIYDLESGESRSIDLSEQVHPEGALLKAIWSPSQQWLGLTVRNDIRESLWVYNLETGDLKHVADANARTTHWSGTEDILAYIPGGGRTTSYNPATGQETVWGSPSLETFNRLLAHDGLRPDPNALTCWICVHPELGQVRDYLSRYFSVGRFHYNLIDTETMELTAHVATFLTERDLRREYFLLDIAKLFPLAERGDYLLFVYQSAGPTLEEIQRDLYSAWSLSSEMPFTIVEGEQTNTLPDVLPMAVSPDGASFLGFRITNPEPFLFLVESAVVVDLATAEILYEYPVPYSEFAYFFPPDEMNGVHMVWPGE